MGVGGRNIYIPLYIARWNECINTNRWIRQLWYDNMNGNVCIHGKNIQQHHARLSILEYDHDVEMWQIGYFW